MVDLTPLIGLDLDSTPPPTSTTSINLKSMPGARREWGELGNDREDSEPTSQDFCQSRFYIDLIY